MSDLLSSFCEMNIGLPNAEEGVPVIWLQCLVKYGNVTVLYKQ
jgi:hypothetical protein